LKNKNGSGDNMGVPNLGNNHPKDVEAVKKAVQRGIGFAAPTELENELAGLICEAAPCADKKQTVSIIPLQTSS
jgi:glutamate-1-semialdehyde aminotransferase